MFVECTVEATLSLQKYADIFKINFEQLLSEKLKILCCLNERPDVERLPLQSAEVSDVECVKQRGRSANNITSGQRKKEFARYP